MDTARNGMLSTPMKGSSPTCWILSTSASGTRPSRTARRCSGPLKPSWPPAFTVMLTAPSVCFLTASAKAMALWVWKLPSGHTVDMSQFAVAAMARVERWPAASIVAAPAVTAAGRMIDAVEGGQDVERRIDAAADFDDLAETAAGAAGAARIRSQLLAPEDQRRLRLRDLDGRAADAAGIGGSRQSILG